MIFFTNILFENGRDFMFTCRHDFPPTMKATLHIMVIGPKKLVYPQILLMKVAKGLVDEKLGHSGYSPIAIRKGV